MKAVEVRRCNETNWLALKLAKSGAFLVATDRLRDDVIICTLQEAAMKARALEARLEFKGRELEVNKMGTPTWRFTVQGLTLFTREELVKALKGKADLVAAKPKVKQVVVTFEGKKTVISRQTGPWVIKVKNPRGPIDKMRFVVVRELVGELQFNMGK